jgi:hypothetical protein
MPICAVAMLHRISRRRERSHTFICVIRITLMIDFHAAQQHMT